MADTDHETELSDQDADHRAHWLIENWRYLRRWLAVGRPGSKYWVPRVGDRVRLHGRGAWLVYAVWIRRGEVQLGGEAGIQRLTDVAPARRADLDALYGRPDWDRPVSGRDWVFAAQALELSDGEEVFVDAEEDR